MMKYAANAQSVRACVAGILGSALVGFAPQVLAAELELEEEEFEELSEVQVTGTRIQNPNVTSANPVTSITGEEMRNLGIVNVADALTQLVPQNLSTYMPGMTGDDQSGSGGGGMDRMDRGSFFIGNTIANLRGLDPAFGTRTLTLIDGRRVVSTSNQADVVDMNIVPSNLLQRMDVVTGGASATYGSGAMAGVVNMVLDNKRTGVSVDMDYGVNEAGDGSSPHVSISGGLPLFGGRGHLLLSGEWQNSSAIRNCAGARSWCAESRTLFTNYSGLGSDPSAVANPLPGFEGLPARFEMENVRFSQFSPNGAIYHNDANLTSGYRFTDDGTGFEEYAYGFRGGTGSSVLNGDGPLTTFNQTMRPSNERKVFFTNFEYNFTERTTGYFQGNYSMTEGLNRNQWTQGTYCARFNEQGVRGTNAPAQAVLTFGTTAGGTVDGVDYNVGRSPQFGPVTPPAVIPEFAAFLGLPGANGTNGFSTSFLNGNGWGPGGVAEAPRRGVSWPFIVPVSESPNPPDFDFNGNAVGTWVRFKYSDSNWQPGAFYYTDEFPDGEFWILDTLTLTNAFDVGTATVLPALGRNSYAFLEDLSPEALYQVQNAFSNSLSAGSGAGVDTLFGGTPCNGFTAIRKVWNPQVQQWTSNESDTMRVVAGVRGRFGNDWRWDAYVQYGQTDSASYQTNVATNLRLAWAMDAVIDDRPDSPTFGDPVCRVTRDGAPVLDTTGRPLSNPESLAALAAGCQPINIFGSAYADPVDAARQQAAIDYSFVDTESSGTNKLTTLALNTNGTLWQGWAGPLTGAFGLEIREDSVDNKGSTGDFYLRSDLARTWADAYGGKTRVTEGYTELNMPLVNGQEGLNLVAVNFGARYASYKNEGGAGTTGESATQNVFNWKGQLVYEPFDFVRLRLTRSRDLRAATYRDLFRYQPSIPDQFNIRNPWRERTATSTENQNERYGQVQVGNANLKPEKSDTLTLGMVLSPGGWAQGMRLSVDYYDISVKDGINTPFNSQNPVNACWEGSGNIETVYADGEIAELGVNGLFDVNNPYCQELTFAEELDSLGNPIPGTRNLHDLVSYNSARPNNALPYKRRGVDVAWSFSLPLRRVAESLPGSVTLSIRGQRALESSGIQQTSSIIAFGPNPDPCGARLDARDPNNPINADGSQTVYNRYTCIDLVGQIRNGVFVPGVAATPKWTGNISTTYMVGNLTTSLSARYIGGARFDNRWCDTGEGCDNYQNERGQYLIGSIDNNWVDPYFNFALNGSYNLQVANLRRFQVFGSINNLFDKSPPFTGGGISGASAGYHDTYGRSYRMGVRMQF